MPAEPSNSTVTKHRPYDIDNSMENRQKQIYRTTLVGSAANLGLLVFKFAAGVMGHSSAMIADAIHSLSDFVTDIIVVAFVKISGKPRDTDHQYGHGKYETLATVIIGLALIGIGVGIFYTGAVKIRDYIQGIPIGQPGMIALVAALVSIAVKESLYHYTLRVGRRVDSQAVIANAWHHRSDSFSSIATALGIGGAILLGEHWAVLDPIAAVLVSIMILKVAFSLVAPGIGELLEKSLPAETEDAIRRTVGSDPDVSDLHNLRTRRIGPVCSVEFHIRMDGSMTVSASHMVTRRLESSLRALLGPETIINIHVEPRK